MRGSRGPWVHEGSMRVHYAIFFIQTIKVLSSRKYTEKEDKRGRKRKKKNDINIWPITRNILLFELVHLKHVHKL